MTDEQLQAIVAKHWNYESSFDKSPEQAVFNAVKDAYAAGLREAADVVRSGYILDPDMPQGAIRQFFANNLESRAGEVDGGKERADG